MKLKYYGTAAAEGFPGMFCECDTCRRARTVGGRNIRSRSQSTVDDTVLIDAGPDTYLHVINHGLDLTRIRSVLVTHSHFDHFDVNLFSCIGGGMAQRDKDKILEVYAGQSAYEKLYGVVPERIDLHLVRAFESFFTCGYEITPLPAMHSPLTSPFNYVIANGGNTVLYAHDTGVYNDEVFAFIKKKGFVFDLVSLDCTYGAKHKAVCDHHMNIDANKAVREKLTSIGAVNENTVLVANHFSHFCENTYDELVNMVKNDGITVSFDGLELEI